MSFSIRRLLWLSVILLCACSTGHISEGYLKKSEPVKLKLLPPNQGPVGFLLKQKISMVYGEQLQVFLMVSRFEQSRVRTVILLSSGQKLLSMEYNGEQLTIEGVGADKLPGKEIMAMMQFSLWAETSIDHNYPVSDGWQFEVSALQRLLKKGTKRLIKVEYMDNQTDIINYQHQYKVIVETLEKSES